MKKVSKTEIRQAVETAVSQVLERLEIPKASKKTRRTIVKMSRQIKSDWKRQAKKSVKASRRNGKVHATAESTAA